MSVAVLAVVFVLLIIFIAQNTGRVAVRFLGWTWHAPLAVVILTGTVARIVLAVVAGSLRIWQLHRRVRRSGG
jgi:putative membrane protein